VLDFGLAKLTERPQLGEDDPTRTTPCWTDEGTILGTASYMSPEQAAGKPVDARSDIFSFGSVLYEMGTGQRAFQGDSQMSILVAVLNQDPKPASEISRPLPHDLEKIINRCLRKDPERRFQYMADVKVALQEVLEEATSGELPRIVGPAHSHILRVAIVGGLAACLVALALTFWVWRFRDPGQTHLTVTPLTTYPGHEDSPTFSPDGSQVAFCWNGEKQDNDDIYVKHVGTESRLRLTHHPGEDLDPSWSPDGRWIAFLRRGGGDQATLLLISPVGGRERRLGEFRYESLPDALSWSPDNLWLAVPDQPAAKESQGLFLVSVETGERRRLTSCPELYLGDFTPAFSPDGQTLAFARFINGAASDLYLLPLSKEMIPTAETTRLTSDNRRSMGPAWTPGRIRTPVCFGRKPARGFVEGPSLGTHSPRGLASRRGWRLPLFTRAFTPGRSRLRSRDF
jgi:serine/threonine protein kinase